MNRRDFITLFGGAAAAPAASWAVAAHAQSSPIRPLIGVLSPLSAAAAMRNIAAFRATLRDLGYVDGRSATLAVRFGDGDPARMAPLARELVALKPDVIFGGSKSGAIAVHDATKTIPVVVITGHDPVLAGFAKSIARPGGNVTGMWPLGDDGLVGKRLEYLQLAAPGITRVGAVFNPDDPTDAFTISRLPYSAKALGIALVHFEVRAASELDGVANKVASSGLNGLFVGQGPTLNSARAAIAAMAARLKLPAVYGWREFVDAGGLMSYGASLPDMYRQAARLVGRVLKGEKPANLPFELPTRYELIVNLKTAKATKLKISDSFLLLADEVLE